MSAKNTVKINSLVLAQHDYKTAQRNIRCADNTVVVEMMPIPKRICGLLVSMEGDKGRHRDDVGMVMAADPDTGLIPGTYVVVRYGAGLSYENFSVGTYKAKNEVRILGRTQTGGTNGYKIERYKMSSYVLARLKVNMFDIDFITPGQELPISKRLSIDTYESYVRISSEVSPKLDKFHIVDPIGTGKNTITLKPGSAFRVTVRNCGGSVFQTTIERIGDDTLEFAYLTDRELPITAFADKMIVELDEIKDQTTGGVYLPDSEAHRSTKATVLSIGAQCDHSGVTVGDRVLVTPGSLSQTLDMTGINNKCLRIVPESAVLSVLIGEEGLTARELDKLQLVG